LRTAIAEGSWATDSLSEDVINVTDVTDVTEISQKVLLIKKRRKKQSRAYVSAIKNVFTVRAVAITF
jgi:acetolactate synthase small subunit